jgi:hypothetical protein
MHHARPAFHDQLLESHLRFALNHVTSRADVASAAVASLPHVGSHRPREHDTLHSGQLLGWRAWQYLCNLWIVRYLYI